MNAVEIDTNVLIEVKQKAKQKAMNRSQSGTDESIFPSLSEKSS
jgi:hypothetical protein